MALLEPLSTDVLTNFKVVLTESTLSSGKNFSFRVTIPARTLRVGQFLLYFALGDAKNKEWYDVVDNNVNLPALNIMAVDMDQHNNLGLFSIPYKIEMNG